MEYTYDKDEIKNSLDIVQVQDFVAELGGEPILQGDTLVCKTICHGGEHHKLYYYDNTHLFKCFTDCSETFDIYQLVYKIMKLKGVEWTLPGVIHYVAQYFGYSPKEEGFNLESIPAADLTTLKKYAKIKEINLKNKEVELKEYNDTLIKNLPKPIIESWIEEGISKEVMDNHNICFNPIDYSIVIPHYDIDGRLIGIRERTLVQEREKYGKYLPAKIYGKMYNHPLGFNLYNLNNSKDNISRIRKAVIFEGEKSALKYASIFGEENDISVAICGSSFVQYQFQLLQKLGVEEIIIALDKQYKVLGDDEHKKLCKNLENIHKKFGSMVKISYMFDKEDLLNYKDSPIDQGKETFLKLFQRRINLYAY